MQIIFITGHLTKDAVLKSTTTQGIKREFVSFSVACNEQRGDERSTTYYDVTMPKTGVLDYLKQGTKVNILGRYRFTQTPDKDGKMYPHHHVYVFDLELADSKKQQEGEAPIPGA